MCFNNFISVYNISHTKIGIGGSAWVTMDRSLTAHVNTPIHWVIVGLLSAYSDEWAALRTQGKPSVGMDGLHWASPYGTYQMQGCEIVANLRATFLHNRLLPNREEHFGNDIGPSIYRLTFVAGDIIARFL